MKRNPLNIKISRYNPKLQHIFDCDLRTKAGQRKWARFFGWDK
ncbi:MAG: hypothetical protein JWM16_3363 [Verrucomicrobiales bacterium]|jgi:hypothetical protein|nr:hypothetical protein [Verrucomicrobiales bacterium]